MVQTQNLLYVIDRKMWLRWDAARWVTDEAEIVLEGLVHSAMATARVPITSPRTRAVKKAVSLTKGVSIYASSLDPVAGRSIGVKNGKLSLIDGTLAPPDRGERRTKTCAMAYDPEATDPLWDRVVSDLLPPDVARYVQTALGYAMTGNPVQKAFLFAHGPPNSGKSLFANAVAAVMGDYATICDDNTWVKRRWGRNDLVKQSGARLVVAPIRGQHINSTLVRQVTGLDYPAVTCTLWMISNSLPDIAGDVGMLDRIRIIPFDTVIPKHKRDPSLPDRLREPAAAAAILRWLVDGARRYLAEGLITPRAVLDRQP